MDLYFLHTVLIMLNSPTKNETIRKERIRKEERKDEKKIGQKEGNYRAPRKLWNFNSATDSLYIIYYALKKLTETTDRN